MAGITIFSTTRPFAGAIGCVQAEALRSWLLLEGVESVLVFAEPGPLPGEARDPRVHVAEIGARSKGGRPLVDELFARASRASPTDLLVYANADIVLAGGLAAAMERLQSVFVNFLAVAERTDVEVAFLGGVPSALSPLTLSGRRRRHGPTGIDVFGFSRHSHLPLRPFAIGRPGWDNYLVFASLLKGWPVVDVTSQCSVLHMECSRRDPRGWPAFAGDIDYERNWALAGDGACQLDLRDCSHAFTRDGRLRTARASTNIPRAALRAALLHFGLRRPVALARRLMRWARGYGRGPGPPDRTPGSNTL